MTTVSVIIPVYNEEAVIRSCLQSLSRQSVIDEVEVILVDDGSTDQTITIIDSEKSLFKNLVVLSQNHLGPGAARNLGAAKAKGDILVFVDADMEFDKTFLSDLTNLIKTGKTIGTYSTEELLLNSENPWAVCWNLNFFHQTTKAIKSEKYSVVTKVYLSLKNILEKIEMYVAPIAHQNITRLANGHSHLPYRAILKKDFLSVGGFSTNVGYTDDWTIAEKLNRLPTPVLAKYYHRSPGSLAEIYRQARWVGRGVLMSGNLVRRLHAIVIHNPISSLVVAFVKALKFRNLHFLPFRVVYDTGILVSVVESFFFKKTAR